MVETIETRDHYAADFAAFEAQAVQGPSWLSPLRKAALSRFAEIGFPTRRDEEWRFFPVAPIAEVPFQRASTEALSLTAEEIKSVSLGDSQGSQLVFVNGRYAPKLSHLGMLPPGVQVGSLAEALRAQGGGLEPYLGRYAQFENQAFVALNTAFWEDGGCILIPKNAVIEEPIYLRYVATSPGQRIVSHPRTLIVAGENSQATIVESFVGFGDGEYFTNAVTEVVAAPNAHIDHYKLQRESENAFHVATMQVQLGRGSNFSSHSIALGGALVRNDVNALLNAEQIECTLNGLYLANGKQVIDNHTAIDHAKPYCNSHEVYKGILDDRSRGVFNGKIFVRQDAQKTDAKQTNKTLLLSDQALINTKPQLEIFADDVKCTHGATIGQLDADAIFYLRARGIGLAEARALLTHAFAGDIINRIKIDSVRAALDKALFAKLKT